MDNSVPSYPPQERLKSVDDHEEAPESSEMTWTLSQLIRKVRKVNRQANAPKEIEQDKPIQMPTDTPAQMYKEFTPELSPVTTLIKCMTSLLLNSAQSTILFKYMTSLLLNLVQSTPMIKDQMSSLTRPVLKHNKDMVKHLNLTVKFPPVNP
jgi:hypothetical protein